MGQTVFHGERPERALAILREPVGGADPQPAVVGRRQRGDRVVWQVAVGLVEDHKLVAVETRQPLVGAQPEVAVFRLRNGADRVLWQTALLRPDGARILRKTLARIQGERPDRKSV